MTPRGGARGVASENPPRLVIATRRYFLAHEFPQVGRIIISAVEIPFRQVAWKP